MSAPVKFQVQQLGAGFLAIGNWYWCRLGPDGFPSEPISAHGPYLLKCVAIAKGRKALGSSAQPVSG